MSSLQNQPLFRNERSKSSLNTVEIQQNLPNTETTETSEQKFDINTTLHSPLKIKNSIMQTPTDKPISTILVDDQNHKPFRENNQLMGLNQSNADNFKLRSLSNNMDARGNHFASLNHQKIREFDILLNQTQSQLLSKNESNQAPPANSTPIFTNSESSGVVNNPIHKIQGLRKKSQINQDGVEFNQHLSNYESRQFQANLIQYDQIPRLPQISVQRSYTTYQPAQSQSQAYSITPEYAQFNAQPSEMRFVTKSEYIPTQMGSSPNSFISHSSNNQTIVRDISPPPIPHRNIQLVTPIINLSPGNSYYNSSPQTTLVTSPQAQNFIRNNNSNLSLGQLPPPGKIIRYVTPPKYVNSSIVTGNSPQINTNYNSLTTINASANLSPLMAQKSQKVVMFPRTQLSGFMNNQGSINSSHRLGHQTIDNLNSSLADGNSSYIQSPKTTFFQRAPSPSQQIVQPSLVEMNHYSTNESSDHRRIIQNSPGQSYKVVRQEFEILETKNENSSFNSQNQSQNRQQIHYSLPYSSNRNNYNGNEIKIERNYVLPENRIPSESQRSNQDYCETDITQQLTGEYDQNFEREKFFSNIHINSKSNQEVGNSLQFFQHDATSQYSENSPKFRQTENRLTQSPENSNAIGSQNFEILVENIMNDIKSQVEDSQTMNQQSFQKDIKRESLDFGSSFETSFQKNVEDSFSNSFIRQINQSSLQNNESNVKQNSNIDEIMESIRQKIEKAEKTTSSQQLNEYLNLPTYNSEKRNITPVKKAENSYFPISIQEQRDSDEFTSSFTSNQELKDYNSIKIEKSHNFGFEISDRENHHKLKKFSIGDSNTESDAKAPSQVSFKDENISNNDFMNQKQHRQDFIEAQTQKQATVSNYPSSTTTQQNDQDSTQNLKRSEILSIIQTLLTQLQSNDEELSDVEFRVQIEKVRNIVEKTQSRQKFTPPRLHVYKADDMFNREDDQMINNFEEKQKQQVTEFSSTNSKPMPPLPNSQKKQISQQSSQRQQLSIKDPSQLCHVNVKNEMEKLSFRKSPKVRQDLNQYIKNTSPDQLDYRIQQPESEQLFDERVYLEDHHLLNKSIQELSSLIKKLTPRVAKGNSSNGQRNSSNSRGKRQSSGNKTSASENDNLKQNKISNNLPQQSERSKPKNSSSSQNLCPPNLLISPTNQQFYLGNARLINFPVSTSSSKSSTVLKNQQASSFEFQISSESKDQISSNNINSAGNLHEQGVDRDATSNFWVNKLRNYNGNPQEVLEIWEMVHPNQQVPQILIKEYELQLQELESK